MRERGGRSKGIATSKTELAFGSFGLKAQTNAWITSRQIEASRRAMTANKNKHPRHQGRDAESDDTHKVAHLPNVQGETT